MTELSPMMSQYRQVKQQHKDEILFFRLGDFYEMFFEDALLASRELELTLTGRDCGLEERAPMCGVPFHSCESYINKLIQKGYKIAICEQMEDPALAKGLVRREVTRVITPGTITETAMLDESRNNYICCLLIEDRQAGVCFADISTGEIYTTEITGGDLESKIINELARYSPSEMITGPVITKKKNLSEYIKTKMNCLLDILTEEDMKSGETPADSLLKKHPGAADSIAGSDIIFHSLNVLLSYLSRVYTVSLERITKIERYQTNQFMNLDITARRNLELLETMRNKEKRGSLLGVLDKTKTAMGKRLLRKYIEQPLLNPVQIRFRLECVKELVEDSILRQDIIEHLSGIFDMERLLTRIVYGTSNARELRSLSMAVTNLPALKQLLSSCEAKLLQDIYGQIDPMQDVKQLIDSAIVDDPPVTVRDGGLIKAGHSAEIDELNDILNNSKEYLAQIEAKEKEKTGIKNLKIGYNRVFGYYLEVTKSFISMVPDTYIRKQTLTNCERFIIEELKELEAKILTAHERIKALEFELFDQIRKQVAENLDRIQQTSSAIAMLDVFAAFADISSKNQYCCPEVNLSDVIDIKEGRHPVIEQISEMPFVSNDVYLDNRENQIAIITGPNMAGKSTYMRQTALIVLMAQIGSFIPAESATIGIVDSIFTRVGASDDLSSGQSTFMVEMSEVASILKNATDKSLIVFDEIGRGTSTFDGMSIARAVLEYVVKKIGAKTLFATHYHELTVIESEIQGVKNYNIAVKKRGDDITFLRRIVQGPADDSYGIEVAKLAGINSEIIRRANQILLEIENKDEKINIESKQAKTEQLNIFDYKKEDFVNNVKGIDIMKLTPIDAMNILYKIVEKAKNL